MEIGTQCPKCGFEFDYDDDDLGKTKECPNCGKKYVVDWDCDYEDAVIIANFNIDDKE